MEILDAQKFTFSLLLIGLLLSALNVLSLFPQAPRSGRGALRRGPERGLFIQILQIFAKFKILQIFEKNEKNLAAKKISWIIL